MGAPRPLVGISACLLGRAVRYDGGHCHEPELITALAEFCDLLPVCPEVECGLPTPREPMRLVGKPENPKLLVWESNSDHTTRLLAWAEQKAAHLATAGLIGFICKSKSPSCGPAGVKLYPDPASRAPSPTASGLFARELQRALPRLHLAQGSDLQTPTQRDKFIRLLLGKN